jgi:hypothetical protein
MTIEEYLAKLDTKLQEMAPIIISSSIQREIDINLGLGFIKGRVTFVDGSTLEFSEQLPVERTKFRFHCMDAENNLSVRWDSAPHYRELRTFPFHLHTPQGVEEHPAITLLEVLDEIGAMIELQESQL